MASTYKWSARHGGGSKTWPEPFQNAASTAKVRQVACSQRGNRRYATEFVRCTRSSIAAIRRLPARCVKRRQTRRRVSKRAQPPAGIWRDLRRSNVVDAVGREHNGVEMPVLELAQIGRVAMVEFELRRARPQVQYSSWRSSAEAPRRAPADDAEIEHRRARPDPA